jgi:hypothetical protein
MDIDPKLTGYENAAAVRVFLNDDFRLWVARADAVEIRKSRNRWAEIHAYVVNALAVSWDPGQSALRDGTDAFTFSSADRHDSRINFAEAVIEWT